MVAGSSTKPSYYHNSLNGYNAAELKESLKELNNDNKQSEYYLTDTLEILRNKGNHISSVILDDIAEASGVNSVEQLKELEKQVD